MRISEIAHKVGSLAAVAAFGVGFPPAYRGMVSSHNKSESHKHRARALGCSDEYIEQFDREAIAYAHASIDENFTVYLACYGLLIERLSAGKEVEPVAIRDWAIESSLERVGIL